MIRVAINGFGRIGRMAYRIGYEHKDIEFVAINDLTDTKTLAHLLRRDSVHGLFDKKINFTEDSLNVNGKLIHVFKERDPEKLPWKDLNVDVVLECTGLFRKREQASKHLKAGAKKVIISAPGEDCDITIVMGVNHHLYDSKKHQIISNASCTTNSLAPVVKVINDVFGIKKGFITTVHSFTNDQKLLDLPHSDLRRARSAVTSIIPTTTGAAKAVGLVIPELNGKLNGISLRVPTPDGSITDFVAELKTNVTKEEINFALKRASEYELKGILEYSEEPLVSIDIVNNPHSSIIDGLSTMVIDNLVKIEAWYDNEWGYSNRIIDLLEYIMKN